MSSTPPPDSPPPDDGSSGARWNLAAALATWLVPGLGHILIGQARRGVILMVTIGLLWTAGLAVGGISVVDSHGHTAWFLGQMFMSPSIAADQVHRALRGAGEPPLPKADSHSGRAPAYQPAFGRVREQGTLYTSLAGLLNLLVILDVVYREPGEAEPAEELAQEPGEKPGAPPASDRDSSRPTGGEARARAPAAPAGSTTAFSFALPALWAVPAPTLGYRPFLQPLPLDRYWFLFLIPLAIAIAVVYKTIKVPSLRQLPRQAAWLSFQIIAFMVLAALALWLVTDLV